MPDQHPPKSELSKFANRELPDEQFEAIAAHLENCDLCANVLRATDVYDELGEGLGTIVGPYKLLQKLAEGGMGTVYLAEQERPVRRMVALKIIKPGMDSSQVIARFEAERQALAMMDHHHIAKVLDAGTTQADRPYFVMELIKGIPITDYCDKNRLTLRDRLKLFIPVCQAIQHAHQKGIIHRDIKPTNVLVTLYDGQPVPKVIDFGIAKATQQRLTERTMFTGIGQILGTLEYMSPEQSEMNQLDIDSRSDVYSLGVLLYELLTGSTPITKEQLREVGLEEMLRTIRESEPPKPSTRLSDSGEALHSISAVRKVEPAKLSKFVRGDLDWIVMKALEKDRTRRYETANGMALDVQRFLHGEAVFACPPSVGYIFRKFAYRNKAAIGTGLTIAVLLLASTVISTWFAVRATRAEKLASQRLVDVRGERDAKETARAEAEAAKTRSEASRDIARRNAYAADMNSAGETLQRTHNVRQVKSLLERHRPQPGEKDLRGWEWRYLWQFCQSEADHVITNVGEPLRGLSVSPDGRLCAVAADSGRLEVWSLESEQRVARRSGMQTGFRAVEFSPDGQQISTVLQGGVVELCDAASFKPKLQLETGDLVVSQVAFSPRDNSVATLSNRHATLWNRDTGKQISSIPCNLSWKGAGDICFSPDGKILIVADNHSLQAFDVSKLRGGELVPNATFSIRGDIASVAVAGDNKSLAYSLREAPFQIVVVESNTGTPIAKLDGHRDWVTDLEFFGSAGQLWSASADNTIRKWDIHQQQQIRVLHCADQTFAIAKLPDEETLLSVGASGKVSLWNIAGDLPKRGDLAHQVYFDTLGTVGIDFGGLPAVSSDENTIVHLTAPTVKSRVAEFANNIEFIQIDGSKTREVLNLGRQEYYGSVVYVADDLLATTTLSGKVLIVNTTTRELVAEWQAHMPHERDERQTWLAALCTFGDHVLSRHGLLATHKLFVNDADMPVRQEVKFWSLGSWQPSSVLKAPPVDECFNMMWFSVDEHMCVTHAANGSKRTALWSTADGKFIRELTDTSRVAFSPTDPDVFVNVKPGGRVLLLSLRDGSVSAEFEAHNSGLTDAVFLPDGTRLLTGGSGKEFVRIWDVETQRLLLNLEGQGQRARLRVSKNGNVIVACNNGPIHVWRAPTWEEIEKKESAGRLGSNNTQRR